MQYHTTQSSRNTSIVLTHPTLTFYDAKLGINSWVFAKSTENKYNTIPLIEQPMNNKVGHSTSKKLFYSL